MQLQQSPIGSNSDLESNARYQAFVSARKHFFARQLIDQTAQPYKRAPWLHQTTEVTPSASASLPRPLETDAQDKIPLSQMSIVPRVVGAMPKPSPTIMPSPQSPSNARLLLPRPSASRTSSPASQTGAAVCETKPSI